MNTKKELENNKISLELSLNDALNNQQDCQAQLVQIEKDLKDLGKLELTSSQMDDIYEAVEEGVGEFDFSDQDNFDTEFELDYDNKVTLSNLELCNHQDLVEMIVEQISKLFTEAEELDTTEDDNHITGIPNGDTISDTE